MEGRKNYSLTLSLSLAFSPEDRDDRLWSFRAHALNHGGSRKNGSRGVGIARASIEYKDIKAVKVL